MTFNDFLETLITNKVAQPTKVEKNDLISMNTARVIWEYEKFYVVINIFDEREKDTYHLTNVGIWTSLCQEIENDDFENWHELNYNTLKSILTYLLVFNWVDKAHKTGGVSSNQMLEDIKEFLC